MAQSTWSFVYGGNGVPDVVRASFRRLMTRTGISIGAATAATMHVVMFIVNALPRGVVGGVTAFMWQVVTIVPLTIAHALGGVVLGWLLNKVCVAIAVSMHGRAHAVVDALCAVVCLVPFGLAAALLAAPSLLLEADPRFVGLISALIPLVAALGGALLGVVTARRVRKYLSSRIS